MIITILLENTNIYIGCADESTGDVCFETAISAALNKTAAEYAITLRQLFKIQNVGLEEITGGIIASCVPHLTETIKSAVDFLFNINILEVGPGIKTGVDIRIEAPSTLGADMLVSSVAAISEYKYPLAVINLCTVSTISVIDENRRFVGCVIIPGIKSSLDNFSRAAAALTPVAIRVPEKIIGNTTEKAMQSGVIYGLASCIDGMIDRIKTEIGCGELNTIITGEYAEILENCCLCNPTLDKSLATKGLIRIYNKNNRKGAVG